MSAETEARLIGWAAEDSHPPVDAAHRHFEQFEGRDWCAIANEGLRMWNLMFDDKVEDGSAICAVIDGVAASAANGAFAAVAEALGVNSRDLQCAVARYYEGNDRLPAPTTAAALMDLINKESSERKERDA